MNSSNLTKYKRGPAFVITEGAPEKLNYEKHNKRKKHLKRRDSLTECRRCLEPGIQRKCCGAYYCNKCYCKSSLSVFLLLAPTANFLADRSFTCPTCGVKIETADGGIQYQTPSRKELSCATCSTFTVVVILFFLSSGKPVPSHRHTLSMISLEQEHLHCTGWPQPRSSGISAAVSSHGHTEQWKSVFLRIQYLIGWKVNRTFGPPVLLRMKLVVHARKHA